MLKELLSRLPKQVQEDLKQLRFRRQIRAGRFVADEPEISVISKLVKPDDLVIDVGANVGHYTLHLSRCVGPKGRVIAFEPVIDTFALLATNVKAAGARNITLLNIAASSKTTFVAMELPKFATGLDNYYRASIADRGDYFTMCAPLDSFDLPRVSLIKIDAEGHDLQVLEGAQRMIQRDRPLLIVEATPDGEIATWLRGKGYRVQQSPGSANVVAVPT